MPASGPPVVIVPSGGFPVTQVPSGANGAAPFTVVFIGLPITLVASGGFPMTLLDTAGADYSTGPDVTAPTITSANSANNVEGVVLAHALTANEAVTWTITGGADQARFELSGSTLRWASNGVKDFEAPDDSGTNNTFVVQLTATDTALNATNQTITITVTDVDEVAPTITSSNAVNLAEHSPLSHSLTANEAVTWTKTGGADAALFTLAGSTLSMIAKDFEIPVDADLNNTYVVQLTATDTALNATNQTITVTVTDVVEDVPPTMDFSITTNSQLLAVLEDF